MEPARCPSCHAVVASRAAWCGLCFADLRTADQIPAAVVAVPALGESTTPVGPAAPAAPSAASATRPVSPAAPVGPAAGWPCLHCGATVALDLDICPQCGAGFLAGGDVGASLQLPVVGDLARANPGMRIVVGLVAAAVLCGAFLLVMLALGKLL